MSGCFSMIMVKMLVFVLMLLVCGVMEFVVIMLVLVLFFGGYSGMLGCSVLFGLSRVVLEMVRILVGVLVDSMVGSS